MDYVDENIGIDNSRLEEIMAKEITGETQREFFELLKKAQLFMPVSYSPNMFEGMEDAKPGDVFEPEGQVGFNIQYLTAEDGTKAVPLFTSDKEMEKSGIRSSAYILFMSDLAAMLGQTDKYAEVTINPFSDHNISIPIETFIRVCYEPTDEEKEFIESINAILKILKEHSAELEEDVALVYKDSENFMVENAVDGVYVPQIPFRASSNPKYGEDLKYTNILLMPKSTKILVTGQDVDLDIIIAPGSEFNLEEELDEVTTIWKCGAQPFYDD